MAITLRNTKGSALSFSELDGNFSDLDTRVTNLPDSSQVLGLIDSAYVSARVSTTTVTSQIDSAYIQARQIDVRDSAFVSTVIDSAYVQAREATPTITLNRFDYISDSGQTAFTGSDDNGNTLLFDSGVTQVYLNGLLLNPVLDYTLTGKNTVTTSTGIDSDHLITITSLSIS